MVKVRQVGPECQAWQYPAPELANLSAMPPWLAEKAETGGDCLYIDTGGGISKVHPGDWLILLPSGLIRHADKVVFDVYYEVVS